jgi:hypothetical protein
VGEGKATASTVVFSLRVNEFDFSFIGLTKSLDKRENAKSMLLAILKKSC